MIEYANWIERDGIAILYAISILTESTNLQLETRLLLDMDNVVLLPAE